MATDNGNLVKLDPFFVEVIGNRLFAAANEQQATLIRTAFSTVVRDNEDLACGVFTSTARMIAQSVTGTPGHINPMATGVKHFLSVFPPESLAPGDVLVTNDPWMTSGQLNDFTVVTPIFHRGRLVAYFANTCHLPDVGGRLLSGEAFEIYEEGLRIPIMKLFSKGEPNTVLLDIIRRNVRTPDETVGDLYAQSACNALGGQRLQELLEEFRLEEIDGVAHELLARTEAAMRAAIRAIPDGTYEAETWADGFDEAVKIHAAVTIDDDEAVVDFSGSSRQSDRGINVVLNYTAGYTSFAFKALIAPDVPHNDGSFQPITVTAPAGSILNCEEPAAVAGRHLVGHFIPGVIFAALAPVVARAVAGGADPVWVVTWNGGQASGKRRTFTFSSFHVGGMGARATKDGLSTTGFPTGVAGVPTEVVESVTPLVQDYRELRPDSCGAGTFRGGLGQRVAFRTRGGRPWSVAASIDRTVFAPPGVEGGREGAVGFMRFVDGSALATKRRVNLHPDDVVEFGLPGGAGYGDPYLRDPLAVRDDVASGYISLEAAREEYVVVIVYTGAPDALVRLPEQFEIQWEETERLRAARVSEVNVSRRNRDRVVNQEGGVMSELQDERHEILVHAVDAFNAGDLDEYLKLYHPDITFYGYTPEPMGLSKVRGYYDAVFQAFPNLRSTIDDEFWSDDRVVGRFQMRGRQEREYMGVPPAGRDIDVTTISIFHWQGRQVIERWSVSDTFGLLRQLGVALPGAS